MYYKCNKINLYCCGSYIDSPDGTKNKKATINPIDKIDNKYFQYDITIALNHAEIGKHAERNKTTLFTSKYKRELINFSSEKNNCKRRCVR